MKRRKQREREREKRMTISLEKYGWHATERRKSQSIVFPKEEK